MPRSQLIFWKRALQNYLHMWKALFQSIIYGHGIGIASSIFLLALFAFWKTNLFKFNWISPRNQSETTTILMYSSASIPISVLPDWAPQWISPEWCPLSACTTDNLLHILTCTDSFAPSSTRRSPYWCGSCCLFHSQSWRCPRSIHWQRTQIAPPRHLQIAVIQDSCYWGADAKIIL